MHYLRESGGVKCGWCRKSLCRKWIPQLTRTIAGAFPNYSPKPCENFCGTATYSQSILLKSISRLVFLVYLRGLSTGRHLPSRELASLSMEERLVELISRVALE